MWTKFPLIFLVLLTVLLFFTVFEPTFWSIFLLLIGLALSAFRRLWRLFPLLALCFVFLLFVRTERDFKAAHQPEKVEQLQVLPDTIEVNGDALSFRGRSASQTFQVFYRLKSEKERDYFRKVDKNIWLKVESKVEIPEGQRNFNGFDYRKYLSTQDIFRLVNIQEIRAITEQEGYDLPLLRRKAIVFIQEHFPAETVPYMTGLLFGYLDKDFSDLSSIYTSLGIIHLFALSGMQVNFFIDSLRRLLYRLGLRRDWTRALLLVFSVFYAFLTGLSISILRALLQKNLPLKGLDNFALAFFALLIIRPQFLLTVGGSLSLAFAFVLAMMSDKIEEKQGWQQQLLTSSVLSVLILPLLLLYFHVFQPLSILFTFIFSLLFDFFLLPFLLGQFLLSLILRINLPANFIFSHLDEGVKKIFELFQYPLVLGKPSLSIFLALLLIGGLLFDFFKKKKVFIGLSLAFALLLFFSKYPSRASITMVDIGQGDSIFLQDKWNRQNVLIDTGGRVEFGRQEPWQRGNKVANADKTLIPYLLSRGVSRIDKLILTHPDADHVGDLLALEKRVKIEEIWISPGSLRHADFVARLNQSKAQIHVVEKNERLKIFDDELKVLSPGYTGKGDNNDSIVLGGRFYGKNFLFTGDLEKEGEKDLLADYPGLKVDVLKVGHHGSKGSSSQEFIEQVQPELALVSAGLNNRYHHPHPEVIERLEKSKVKIYRTDLDGAVRLEEKSGSWEIRKVRE